MNVKELDVIVVGGGMGGCAAALLLARAGARVTIVERVARPEGVGAGIALAANGLAVLESLGLTPALASARPALAPRITDARERTLLTPPDTTPRIALLRRATLLGVLLDALAAEGRITRRFGTTLVRVTPDGDVIVRDADGDHAMHADLVIGADGVHSRVRECGAFGAKVHGTGIRYLRALVAEGFATGVEAWTSVGLFGAFAVDGGTYVYASCCSRPCRDALQRRDLEALRAAWGKAYPPAARVLGAVDRFSDLIVNEVQRVECQRWSDGALVLLGDAAHAMAPNLGQGANSAFVDAAVLLDELRRAPALGQALAAYERRRRPAVTRVATAAGRLGRLADATHPVVRAIRPQVLRLAGRFDGARSAAMVLQEAPATLVAIGRA